MIEFVESGVLGKLFDDRVLTVEPRADARFELSEGAYNEASIIFSASEMRMLARELVHAAAKTGEMQYEEPIRTCMLGTLFMGYIVKVSHARRGTFLWQNIFTEDFRSILTSSEMRELGRQIADLPP